MCACSGGRGGESGDKGGCTCEGVFMCDNEHVRESGKRRMCVCVCAPMGVFFSYHKGKSAVNTNSETAAWVRCPVYEIH